MLEGRRVRFGWDPESAHRQLHFGKWIFLGSMVTFLAMQSDRLLVGKLASMTELGIYSIAVMLAFVPREVIFRLSNTVILPIAARTMCAEGAGCRKIATVRLALLGVAALLCVGLSAGAAPAIGLVYDARYAGAKALVAVLAVGIWVQSLWCSYHMVNVAAGQPKYQSWGMIARAGADPRPGRAGLPAVRHAGDRQPDGDRRLRRPAIMHPGRYRLGATLLRLDLLLSAAVVASAAALGHLSERVIAATGSKAAGLALVAAAVGSGLLAFAAVAWKRKDAPRPLPAG